MNLEEMNNLSCSLGEGQLISSFALFSKLTDQSSLLAFETYLMFDINRW